MDISGAAGSVPATVGKTGVTLCWHEPKLFAKLTKEQKVELAEWNRNNPNNGASKKRKSGEMNERRTKARVASAKANG